MLMQLVFWNRDFVCDCFECENTSGCHCAQCLTHFIYFYLHFHGILNIAVEVLMYFTQESLNWIVMRAIMGCNGYIFLSVLVGAGLGYALFGESMAHAKIQSVKMKAAMISCGDCQGKVINTSCCYQKQV